jgi:hypothetical protein
MSTRYMPRIRSMGCDGEGRYCDAYEQIRITNTMNSTWNTEESFSTLHSCWYCDRNHGGCISCSILWWSLQCQRSLSMQSNDNGTFRSFFFDSLRRSPCSETPKRTIYHLPVNFTNVVLNQKIVHFAVCYFCHLLLDFLRNFRGKILITTVSTDIQP